MLYTSFHLAEQAGASTECPGFKSLKTSVKVKPTEGISLLTVLDYAGFQDALWCLRAVHDEQVTRAKKVAGILSVKAAQIAMASSGDILLRDALVVASDRVNLLAGKGQVIQFRKAVWNQVQATPKALKWPAWLVWLSLADDITRKVSEVPECLEAAMASDTELRRKAAQMSLEGTFRNQVTGPLLEDHGPGIYDPSSRLSSYDRYQLGIGNNRRKYTRQNRSIPYNPMKGLEDGS